MGVYIYRIQPKMIHHPQYGDVGVLVYWDKLHWADSDEIKKQERRIAVENKKWQGRLPNFVMFHGDKNIYDFSGNRQAVYYDTEPLPLAP